MSLNLEVCSAPVTTVCDTGTSVSCISQRLSKVLPVNLQDRFQPAQCRLLAANQAEIPAPLHKNFADIFCWRPIPTTVICLEVLRSWLSAWIRLPWKQSLWCSFLYHATQIPWMSNTSLFSNRELPADPSTEQVNVIAKETTFIPAGQEALILGELLTPSFPEISESIFEPSALHFARSTIYWPSVLFVSLEKWYQLASFILLKT